MKIVILLIIVSSVLFCAATAEEIIQKVEFIDASVMDVVATLAKQAGLNLVISNKASLDQAKRTTLRLENVTAAEALEQVLQTNEITYEKNGKVIMLSPLSGEQTEKGQIEVIKLRHLSAASLGALLNKVFPSLKVSQGSSTGQVVLRGGQLQIKEARQLIASVDQPVPQVLIESKVLEISESDSMRLGLSFGKEIGSFTFITDKNTRKTSAADDLQTTINGLIGDGRAKIVASPKIATLDDHEAIINIGSRIPYAVPVGNSSGSTQWTINYIDAGVKLKITPRLGEDGFITTAIQPEVSSISEWRTTSAGDFPVISTRNAHATLRVKDGETIVVGGLLSESDRENVSRVPILGYIPLVGMLFQNKTMEKAKTEIVFLITPHVI